MLKSHTAEWAMRLECYSLLTNLPFPKVGLEDNKLYGCSLTLFGRST